MEGGEMSKGFAVLGFAALLGLLSVRAEPQQPVQQPGEAMSTSKGHRTIIDRLAALERSIDRIMELLSGQARPTEAPVSKAKTADVAQALAAGTAEVTEKRLEAAEKTLSNVAAFLAAKGDKPGSNCHWVRECVYMTCCRWGAPPSDPGTVKCMEQCCGAWENRLVC